MNEKAKKNHLNGHLLVNMIHAFGQTRFSCNFLRFVFSFLPKDYAFDMDSAFVHVDKLNVHRALIASRWPLSATNSTISR